MRIQKDVRAKGLFITWDDSHQQRRRSLALQDDSSSKDVKRGRVKRFHPCPVCSLVCKSGMGRLPSDNLRKISQGSASQSAVPWFGKCPEHSVSALASIRKSSRSPLSRTATVMSSIISENRMYTCICNLYAYYSATPYLILRARNPRMLHVYIRSLKV